MSQLLNTTSDRIEATLDRVLSAGMGESTPKTLRQAIEHAVFPAGSRVRPRLLLEVSQACGCKPNASGFAAAASLELLHCASLVHDDMPCFDNADLRRGRSTVHKEFGQATALLVGDALIVMAFETLVRGPSLPTVQVAMVRELSKAAGAARGIVAGQAWELEQDVSLDTYHYLKTGALFEAACAMGALSAGADPEAFRELGRCIGAVYQLADDIADGTYSSDFLGKSTGKDQLMDRPSGLRLLGHTKARELLNLRTRAMLEAVPMCQGREELRSFLHAGLSVLVNRLLANSENCLEQGEPVVFRNAV